MTSESYVDYKSQFVLDMWMLPQTFYFSEVYAEGG